MPYKSKKILCSICARGGSKEVPLKNIRDLCGIPLIAHSILQAQQAKCFDLIVVSSDCDEILDIAQKFGVDMVVKRPAELATDTAGKLPAIIHCAQEVEKLTSQKFDIFVDLDATSPLRIPDDILNSIDLILETNAPNVITGCRSKKSPYFNLVEKTLAGTVKLAIQTEQPILRRQDAPVCFDMNASIYVWERKSFYNSVSIFSDATRLYEMPEMRSVDVDSLLDLEFVRFLLEKRPEI